MRYKLDDMARLVSAQFFAKQKLLRKINRMSQQELTDAYRAAGYPMTRSTLAGQESDRKATASVDQVVAAARVFNTTVEALCAVDGCPQCLGAPPEGFICAECGATAPTL